METIVEKKVNVKKLREDIKKIASEQKFLRDQRKTVHNKLERKIDPEEASSNHLHNRFNLSIMYAVLLVTRGRSIDEAAKAHITKKHGDWVFDHRKNKIQTILDSYK